MATHIHIHVSDSYAKDAEEIANEKTGFHPNMKLENGQWVLYINGKKYFSYHSKAAVSAALQTAKRDFQQHGKLYL